MEISGNLGHSRARQKDFCRSDAKRLCARNSAALGRPDDGDGPRTLAPLGARVVKSVFPTTTLVAPATRDWNSSRAGENVAPMKLRRRE